jgi:predicted regulator of Ras-like GTPase activity (Roadblock/LC7/MglB family)
MPTIRDLVGTIRQREGVEAAVVLGRDGLLIDSQASDQVNAEQIAAHVPSIVQFADDFGLAAARGAFQTAILEHERGMAVICALSSEAVLLVMVQPSANLGQLLYELRRNRANIAALV